MQDLYTLNTETKLKQKIQSKNGQPITMYTCGPTVYHYVHIGNLRTFVFEDFFKRAIKYFGMQVFQVMNLTDVDDKTIQGALKQGVSLDEFTAPFKKAFFDDLNTLKVQPAEVYPAATAYVGKMISMIEELINKGYAYKSKDGSIFFRIKEFSSYGRLSHLKLEELKEGASERECTAADEYDKESASDFVLWKAYDKQRDGMVFWDSPFGKGRPGWHIECSAMAQEILGESINLHLGGVDNIFPHHDNEIAQSECCTGKRFVNHWMHVEHLIVEGKKMSKSLGNFFTLKDLLEKGYSGSEIRYLLLSSHYRMPLNFTFQGLEAAKNSLRRIEDFCHRLKDIDIDTNFDLVQVHITKAEEEFQSALADDLNISEALSSLFNLIREINTLCDHDSVSKQEADEVLEALEQFDRVLGFLPLNSHDNQIPKSIVDMFDQRNKAREEKDFALADRLRDEIFEKGYIIEDTPKGSKLKTKL